MGHGHREESDALSIRSATAADAAAVAAIYGPVVASTPASFETEPPTAEEMARRMDATTSTHPWLVAEQQGQVVGYAYVAPAHTRAAYRWSVEVSIYLGEHARGRGIGGALLDDLLERVRATSFVTVRAGTTLPNDASVRLFESRGFALVGIFHKTGYKLGRWHDVGWWELVLSDDPGPPRP
ncbi:MAG TPA: GNAT family N-acetyltransferase [Actinomycetota bacterium]|jgi:phosphinothricin acetyltransferase